MVTGCYLGFYFGVVFFGGPKISAFLKLKLLEKDQFPPRDVTWAHVCSCYMFTWPTLCFYHTSPQVDIYRFCSQNNYESLLFFMGPKLLAIAPGLTNFSQ